MNFLDKLKEAGIDTNLIEQVYLNDIPTDDQINDNLDNLKEICIYLLEEFENLAKANTGSVLGDDKFLNVIQNFANKIIRQTNSVFYLLHSEEFIPDTLNEIDCQSISILIRSLIETVLMFCYIYVIPETMEHKKFKYLVWEFTELQENIRRDKEISTKEDIFTKFYNERYEYLKNELLNDTHFKTLKKEYKDKILKCNQARYDCSWSDIAKKLGIDIKYFNIEYSTLCSHSHSGNFSIITDVIPVNVKIDLLLEHLRYFIKLLALFIFGYSQVTEITKLQLKNNLKLVQTINRLTSKL